ncbi:2-isopropylmalate synthase LEU4 [Sugiyamaella lignohabitans]|uniref:2-isopropylmalate synthase n=1 Tax=Sugiyamaella lignohabitans TaxID=796027 RepID=A0A167F8Y7_9ASCO|nr:2-isopropylmalate synthase LEU4 [Sugiyamaella lignohabitans]ANB14975.1 2-isopropylmalate synthase LEU4 [Sugiyamaella lignohabitans]
MTFLKDPSVKYKKFPPINLPNRQWPAKTLDVAPRWLSTDLRDGNQSLPDPMSVEEKKEYFHKLVELGYKEIEVSFPSASQIDFDFTRYAVENAPDDVWIQVLTPCREELIRRTVESVRGAKKAIIHVYLASSPLFRDVIFGMTEQEAKALAVKSTKLVRELTKDDASTAGTEWAYEFSPETFSDTPLEYSVELCEAVKNAWQPSVEIPIIFNLPATVEMSTPNVYADQIEYFSTHISEREKVCISLHPHNDRGCAVAAAELGQMAGAQRVEGCLFGNGERTGNVDLVTLAMNLYTQGVTPNIDFSDITSVVDVVERCNKIPVHARAPYGGSLVVCAFSGSHQDAIKKGFARNDELKKKTEGQHSCWQIPYLPLDPQDVGRTYEAVIRVNSQSGKGGAAWIILRNLELDLPRGLQVAFSKIVQTEAEFKGRELKGDELVNLFEKEYFLEESSANYDYNLVDFNIVSGKEFKDQRLLDGTVNYKGKEHKIAGKGNGPISSFLDAIKSTFDIGLEVQSYSEHSIGKGSATKAATYIELSCELPGQPNKFIEWGVGINEDVSQASILAILSALNRISQRV